jgi:hypothetical protein
MLRTCSCIIALTAMVAAPTAQAADTTLTLACKGKETSQVGARKSSEVTVINIGIIVDLQNKTVVGLEPTVPLTIVDVTETTISFAEVQGEWQMSGTLDRVTGSLVATSDRSYPSVAFSYDLQCTPAQRMF